MRNHGSTLKHLHLGRNRISNVFIAEMCAETKEFSNIETIDLIHLKEVNKVDWVEMLQQIATLSTNRPNNPVRVKLSDYQTRIKQSQIYGYLEKTKPNIEVSYIKNQ